MEHWWNGSDREKSALLKPLPYYLYLSHLPHGLTWDRTHFFEVRNQRLTFNKLHCPVVFDF